MTLVGDVKASPLNYVLVFTTFLGLGTTAHVAWIFSEKRVPPHTTGTTLLFLYGFGHLCAATTPMLASGSQLTQSLCICGLHGLAIIVAQFLVKPKKSIGQDNRSSLSISMTALAHVSQSRVNESYQSRSYSRSQRVENTDNIASKWDD